MAASWDNIEKSGVTTGGWTYNEPNLQYNQVTDPDTGNSVKYNGFGVSQTFTNQSKS